MNPSDTHIERMAETFAERSPLRPTLRETQDVWREALELGREQGTLEQIEQNMRRKKLVDRQIEDVWDRARKY